MLDIFSEKNKIKTKRGISIRSNIIVFNALLSIVAIIIVAYTILFMYLNDATSKRYDVIKTDISLMVSVINNTGFIYNQDHNSAGAQLDALADSYSGRILVIDKNLNIIKDTYNRENGKICISSEVIKCIQDGEEIILDDVIEDYVELVVPIKGKEEGIIGALVVGYSEEDIKDMFSNLHGKIVILILVGACIIGIILFIFANKISNSINKVVTSVDMIAAGHMSDEVVVNDFYETRRLSTSLNTMLAQIQRLENTRQEFVSNVSHELKTPITSMKVLADSLVGQENVPNELYQEFMVDIAAEIDRENKIINDLLSLVKMDKTASELNVEVCNINGLLEVLLKRLKPIAAKRNIEIVFESFREVVAEVDETKLSLALSNLMENAIKYNFEDGWVRVSLNADHKYFYVKVADSGVGIPEDCVDNIFDRFYRVDKARSRETGGTGLGLSITRNVIILHKGAIKVHSKEQEGTTFTVRIPINYIV